MRHHFFAVWSSRQHGLTLIELVVALAIAAVIALLVWPSYQTYTQRTYRTQIIEEIMSEAARQDRMYVATMNFSPREPMLKANGRYLMSVEVTDAPRRFKIIAIPQGPQESDSCGTLTVNHIGDRTAADGADVMRCWGLQ